MMDYSRLKSTPTAALLALAVSLSGGTALAVDDIGLFELDGNAVQDAVAPPDDWATLYGGGGSSFVFTGIKPDPAPLSIFDGGRKDIQDITDWSGKDGSVPDKNDITNGYAAGYLCPAGKEPECAEGDLIVYFGSDRVSNNGDAFMGFWFFKNLVEFDPATGEFSCSNPDANGDCHREGDTLVLANFPQATNAVPEIKVISWDISCNKADNNNPQPGDCAAKNLRLVSDGAVCGEAVAHDACAITNAATEVAPWPFLSKNADPAAPTDFPFESFFEGGINLTKAIGGDFCFASFLTETRSSSSYTASLKDFVLDDFPVCAVELRKACGTGTYNPLSGNLEIPYSVTVKNTGAAAVSEVVATDDDCGFGAGTTLTFGPLDPDQEQTLSATCSIPSGTDLTGGVSNGVSAVADGGDVTVVLADSCVTDPSAPGTCFSACSFDLDPAIGVAKSCYTSLVAEDGVVKVKVNFSGTVTNTSDQMPAPVPLTNVTASDDKAGALTLLDGDMNELPLPVTLEPGESANFVGSYLPDGSGLGFSECPSNAEFMDTVTAQGDDAFLGTTVSDEATATCKLCPPGGCPDQ